MGLLLTAAILAAAPVAKQYPIGGVLNAARDACQIALVINDPKPDLVKAGWEIASVEPGGWIERALRDERALFGPALLQSKVWTRQIDSRQIVAFTDVIKVKKSNLRLCSVQDPRADIQSAPDQIVEWAGRASTSPSFVTPEMQNGFDNITFMKNWKPGLGENADDTTIQYVPMEYGGISDGQNSGLTFTSERLVEMESK